MIPIFAFRLFTHFYLIKQFLIWVLKVLLIAKSLKHYIPNVNTTKPKSMKFGLRIPSITKRIAARTSAKRFVTHNLGVKAPRGMGWVTNPQKALYNKVYNKTSRGCLVVLVVRIGVPAVLFSLILR